MSAQDERATTRRKAGIPSESSLRTKVRRE
jgi:hypothetical protein